MLDASTNSFSWHIQALEGRIAELQRSAGLGEDLELEGPLRELKGSLAGLQAVQQELLQQNQQLEAARCALEQQRQHYQELFDMAPDGYLVTNTAGVIQVTNQAISDWLQAQPDLLVGKPMTDFIIQEDRRAFNLYLNHLIGGRQAEEFEVRLQPGSGTPFPARLTPSLSCDSQGQITSLRWLVHDSTRRNLVEAQRIRQMVAHLSQTTRRTTASLHLPTVMQELVHGACSLVGARYGALGLFDISGEIQEFIAYGLTPKGWDRISASPEELQGSGFFQWLHQQHQPVRLANLSEHPQFRSLLPHHSAVDALLAVPIHSGGETLGGLYMAEKISGTGFTQEDQELLAAFAGQGALAINNALTFQREQAARREVEAAQQALSASEQRFRLLAEKASDLIYQYRLSPTRGFEYVSPSAAQITGYTPEEYYNDPDLVFKLVHPEDRHVTEDLALSMGTISSPLVVRWIRKDQTVVWVEFTIVPRHDNRGSLVAVEGLARDITARKQIEEALRESEGRFRTMVENTNDVLWEVDAEGRYTYCSPSVELVTGYQPAAVVGKTPFDLMPPGEAQRVGALFAPIFAEQRPFTLLTHEVRCKDGTLKVLECNGQPIFDEHGRFLGYRGVDRDVTERTRSEQAVETERQRLARFVDTSPVGIIVTEANGEVSVANREAERILGLSFQPGASFETCIQAVTFSRLDGRPYDLAELPVLRALYYGETVRAQEVRVDRLDGNSVLTLANAIPIHAADGQITGAIGVIQDITALEEAERLRNQILGMASYELRTPLTAIKGAAATALGGRRQLDEAEAQELFKIVNEQADRLNTLVSNLLDLARMESGVLSVSAEPVDIRSVVEESIDAFRRSGASHQVQVKAPDDLPLVRADRLRLEQVLANLLDNAAKFSPPSVPIIIELEYDPIYVTVHVKDHGQGISQEELPNLFRKLSTASNNTGRRPGAPRLGLVICKGVVEAHGGRIWADSSGAGEGAVFSFTLPIAAEPPAQIAPSPAPRTQQTARVSRPAKRPRILAVDDDPHMLRLLRRLLHEADYDTMFTTDPAEAMKFVELEEPDLVLLDLVFPGGSGMDLMQKIREFSEVPVIFVSATEAEETRVQGLRLGADDYVTKPFSPPELLARVETALRRRALAGQTEVRPPLVLDDLVINFAERRVTKAGLAVYLSSTEYKLLHQLAIHSGRVLTHEQLLQQVWGPEYSGESELLRSMIRNLRRKLGDDGRHPRYILTEAQVGYRLAAL